MDLTSCQFQGTGREREAPGDGGAATFHEDDSQTQDPSAPRALAGFCNLAISTIRLAGRADTAHAHRDLLDHDDAFVGAKATR